VLKIVENFLAVGAQPPTPLGELTALPRPPSWWGEGCYPLPENPIPALGLRAFRLIRPMRKSWTRPWLCLYYAVVLT